MVNDKDIDTVLHLLPADAHYYFTQPATSRALPAEELQRRWQAIHISSPHRLSPDNRSFATVAQALAAAQKETSNEDILFIGGSNYVVGEALNPFL